MPISIRPSAPARSRCARTPFPTPPEPVTPTPTPTPNPDGSLVLIDQIIRTQFNVPVAFLAQSMGNRAGYTYSLDFAMTTNARTLADGGQIEIINPTTWELKYTPGFFRGEMQIDVFARKGTIVKQAVIRLQVGNSVNLLAPALALRGSGCVTCHAEVHANIITDFGAGNAYYFGNNPPLNFNWNDGLIYGDQYAFFDNGTGQVDQGAWWRLNLVKNADGSGNRVYVPRSPLPPGPAGATGANTLRAYVQNRLDSSFYPDSHTATAIEKNEVFIGAPTAARLEAVFGWTAADETKKYFATSSGRRFNYASRLGILRLSKQF